ncbi:MAG: hypothetical protein AAFU77_13935 [Myxococcota bacterium]
MSRILLLTLIVGASFSSRTVWAQADLGTLPVLFDGKITPELRKAVLAGLRSRLSVKPTRVDEPGLTPGELASTYGNPETRFLIHVKETRRKRRHTVRARLIDSETGEVSLKMTLGQGSTQRRKKLNRLAQTTRTQARRFGARIVNRNTPATEPTEPIPVADSATPAADAPMTAADTSDSNELVASIDLESESEDESESEGFRLGTFVGVGGRDFEFTDLLFGDVQTYTQAGAVLVGVEAAIQPFSSFPLDLEVSYVRSVSNPTNLEEGESADPAVWSDLAGGLLYRLELGDQLDLGFAASGRQTRYTFPGQDITPDVEYLAAGGELRIIWQGEVFGFGIDGGAFSLLDIGGTLSEDFPNASGWGVQARVRASYAIDSAWSVGVNGQLQQFGLSFAPDVGDPAVAGGAEDRLWLSTVALQWAFR